MYMYMYIVTIYKHMICNKTAHNSMHPLFTPLLFIQKNAHVIITIEIFSPKKFPIAT